jgi:hypothetical protein
MVCFGNTLQILLELWEIFVINLSAQKIMLFNQILLELNCGNKILFLLDVAIFLL